MVFVEKINAAGVALPLILEQVECGLGERALVGLDVHLQLGALETVAAAIDQHVALGLRLVVALVELQAIGTDHRVVAAQFGVALDRRDAVGLAFDAVSRDEGGGLLLRVFGQGFLQHAAGAQRHTGFGHLVPIARLGLHQAVCTQRTEGQQREQAAHRQRHGGRLETGLRMPTGQGRDTGLVSTAIQGEEVVDRADQKRATSRGSAQGVCRISGHYPLRDPARGPLTSGAKHPPP